MTTNRIVFDVCSFSGQNAREGSFINDLSIESSHGREKERNPFTSTGVGKRNHHNRRCKFLLTDDPRRLAPQSPAGTGAKMGPGIGNRDGRLN